MSKINITMPESSFTTICLFKLFDLLGLLLISFCFYKIVPLLFITVDYSYNFYVLLFALGSLLNVYISNRGYFIYLFDSFLYLLILFIAWFYL